MNNGEQWTWTIMNENLVMNLKSLDSSANNQYINLIVMSYIKYYNFSGSHTWRWSSNSMEGFGAADTHHESPGARGVDPDETQGLVTVPFWEYWTSPKIVAI